MACRPYIRVGMGSRDQALYELMDKDGEKIADVTFDEIVAHLSQFIDLIGSLPRESRQRTKVRLGESIAEVSVLDLIEMNMQFSSSLRFTVVK